MAVVVRERIKRESNANRPVDERDCAPTTFLSATRSTEYEGPEKVANSVEVCPQSQSDVRWNGVRPEHRSAFLAC